MSDCEICREPNQGPLCADCAASASLRMEPEKADDAAPPMFAWHRAPDYEVRAVPSQEKQQKVVAIVPVGKQEKYTPTSAPLFREFAALNWQGPDAYRNFALGYGLLGVPRLASDFEGEELNVWALETSQLSRVLSAWDLMRGEDDGLYEDIENDLLGQHAKGPTSQRLSILAAIVADTINDAIARQLYRHSLSASIATLVPRIEVIPNRLEFAITQRPRTLIDTIWAQTVGAIKGWTPDHTECRCGEWIIRPPGKRGRKQKSCSDQCRALFDQKDEAIARRMARQRVARSKIVAATGLKEERVRRIIEEERKRRMRGAR